MERLQKVLAGAGVTSRRKAEELILQGKVTVNENIVSSPGFKVDLKQDVIRVEGKLIKPEARVYILLHKPRGYVTTTRDPLGRPTILDLVGRLKKRIYPVGRLDFDSSGLLLLTNDGELTYYLTHPKLRIRKTYLAVFSGRLDSKAIRWLKTGVKLEDGWTAPCEIAVKERGESSTLLEMTIHEGRNRQIRRMGEAIGHPVIRLKRIKFGPWDLRGLKKPGQYRYLDPGEVDKFKRRFYR
ncbi:MAG: pseudouridine synthase [bacterium]